MSDRSHRDRKGKLHLLLGGLPAKRAEASDAAFAHHPLPSSYWRTAVLLRRTRYASHLSNRFTIIVANPVLGCNKTFTRSDALTKHLRSLHGITPELPPSKKKPKDGGGGSALTSQPLGGGSSPIPPSAVGSSPIAFKRNEVDDVIADALLSPTEPSASVPVSVPMTEIAPAAPSGSASGSGKTARPRKPSRKDRKPVHANGAASTSASASALAIPSQPLPDHSAFFHPDVESLSTDVDLGSVLPRLRQRDQFWTESDDDQPALDLVRERRLRMKRSPPPYPDDIEYDSLDEEIPAMGSPRMVAETTLPEDPTTPLPVMSRTKWQARYMMSKAKVMLLSEENEMRRRDLEKTLMEEMELDQQL